ncbi:hypothetical protein tinsulaeT_30460 [Thalassotalea insulae]|uniref:SnoaL-like domain-containing protein n=1 Tax=Thalassotalea insulae TaxID=2056778 RepID=A0ABQ6GUU1_9GAMM|nr:nuclear transport factor 2 family protein [Thalassotalea insulae]GLX79706.1 hypothetical protein tinsulaeT_30460 [Thalassotalea insulae]
MRKSITLLLLVLTSLTSFAQNANTATINFKSLQKSSWTQQEINNAELITGFVQKLMNDHDFDYVLKHYNDSSYTQHNRNLPDKIVGLVGFLREFVEDYPEYSYEVKHIYVDGDFVIFHSHATLEKGDRGNDQKGMNIIDTWRIENGRIVEHWDSIQALDGFMRFYSLVSGGNIRNTNGVF